jgi:acetyltransferase-like isoleucine patch superfamily enzyme
MPRTLRERLRPWVARAAALAVAPEVLSYRIRARLMGADRALQGSTQALSLVPGAAGVHLRRAFLKRALEGGCGDGVVVSFGTLFSRAGARLDDDVYIGAGCHIGLCHIGRGTLVASGVHVPSGAQTHGTDRTDVPIREQTGRLTRVHIGEGAWIGSGAVVMADVGEGSVIAAGAVVTKPVPDHVVAGGVPAKVLRTRAPSSPHVAGGRDRPRLAIVRDT